MIYDDFEQFCVLVFLGSCAGYWLRDCWRERKRPPEHGTNPMFFTQEEWIAYTERNKPEES